MPSTRNKVQPQNISHEHELDSKGVYQLANGAWAYRFCKSVNGKNPGKCLTSMELMSLIALCATGQVISSEASSL